MLAGAFAAAMKPLGNAPKKCYNCGQPGHLSFQCSKPRSGQGGSPDERAPGLCPRCQKGRHYAYQCQSRFDREGKPLQTKQGNGKHSANQRRAKTQMPLNVVKDPSSIDNNPLDAWISSPQKLAQVPEWM